MTINTDTSVGANVGLNVPGLGGGQVGCFGRRIKTDTVVIDEEGRIVSIKEYKKVCKAKPCKISLKLKVKATHSTIQQYVLSKCAGDQPKADMFLHLCDIKPTDQKLNFSQVYKIHAMSKKYFGESWLNVED